MKCLRHPEVETSLRCGKCGQAICPKCMVQTPVGARCPDCARLYRLPTYRVSPLHYLRALGVGLVMSVVLGFAWWLVGRLFPFYLGLLIGAGVGYAHAELMGLATNRKRGLGLAVLAAVMVVLSYLVSIVIGRGFPFIFFSEMRLLFDLASVGLGIFTAVSRLR